MKPERGQIWKHNDSSPWGAHYEIEEVREGWVKFRMLTNTKNPTIPQPSEKMRIGSDHFWSFGFLSCFHRVS